LLFHQAFDAFQRQHQPQRHADFQQVFVALACDLKPVEAKQFVQDRQARNRQKRELEQIANNVVLFVLVDEQKQDSAAKPEAERISHIGIHAGGFIVGVTPLLRAENSSGQWAAP
jgi:hypothetical protein